MGVFAFIYHRDFNMEMLFVFLALQPFWLYFPQPRSGL
jgi:hypothetical protein